MCRSFPSSLLFSQPTPPPTPEPTVAGRGVCSDDPGATCWTAAECACFAAGGASAPAPEGGSPLFHRELQVACAGNGSHDCRALPLCEWSGGTCVPAATPNPTNPPVTSKPTANPTNVPSGSPVACECNGAVTKAPTPDPTKVSLHRVVIGTYELLCAFRWVSLAHLLCYHTYYLPPPIKVPSLPPTTNPTALPTLPPPTSLPTKEVSAMQSVNTPSLCFV